MKKRTERIRFIKFAVVGVTGAVVDFAVMNLLTHLLHFSLTLSGTISFICAVLNNFLWNRLWTYPDSRSKPLPRQLGMFYIVNTAGMAIRLPILLFVEPVLARLIRNLLQPLINHDIVAKNFTLAIAVLVVMLWNYFVNRYWTYNDIE